MGDWAVVSRSGTPVPGVTPVFDDGNMELTYQHQPGSRDVHYWQLPTPFLGNKLTAYAGNLTVFHRSIFSGSSVEDSEVIMKGAGLELHYGLGAGPFLSGEEHRSQFTMTEAGWFVLNSGVPVPATKSQFMKVLSNIEVGLLPCLEVFDLSFMLESACPVLSEQWNGDVNVEEGDDGHCCGSGDRWSTSPDSGAVCVSPRLLWSVMSTLCTWSPQR